MRVEVRYLSERAAAAAEAEDMVPMGGQFMFSVEIMVACCEAETVGMPFAQNTDFLGEDRCLKVDKRRGSDEKGKR
jgi:hypothetical protein